jgi:pectinesterase inhibitor-like protein
MTRLSSVVVVFLLYVSFTYATKIVDVNTICKNTMNPSFCSALLNSNPGASQDLVTLAQYTIDVAHTNATNTINLIKKLIAQKGSSEAHMHYHSCLFFFNEIISTLVNS